MNCDIVMQMCVYNDYPIFRHNLNKYRDRVNKVIIYPSRHHGFIDLEDFLKSNIKENWVDPVSIDYGKEDWRQAETIPCLKHVESEWIWFSEQDFFVRDWDKFYNDIEREMETNDLIGWWNETTFSYVHPCCFFIKKKLLEQTNLDFSAHPEQIGSDHFAMITQDAIKLGGKLKKLQDMGWVNWENAMHLGGLTYPYQNWPDKTFGVGNIEAFFAYNYCSRQAKVNQSDKYLDLSLTIEDELIKRGVLRDCINKYGGFYAE